jgi:hypothetical protein
MGWYDNASNEEQAEFSRSMKAADAEASAERKAIQELGVRLRTSTLRGAFTVAEFKSRLRDRPENFETAVSIIKEMLDNWDVRLKDWV